MAGKGEQIDVVSHHVNFYRAGGRCAIDEHQEIMLASDTASFGNRQQRSRDIGCVEQCDQPGIGLDRGFNLANPDISRDRG